MWLFRYRLLERDREPRFADAGFAGDQHHAAFAALHLVPAAQQDVEFLLTSDKRRPAKAQRLEPALDCALAQYLGSPHRLGNAFERDGAKIAIIEEAPDESPRARTDQHRPRFGQHLQTRSEIWRLADHCLLLCSTCADQVANHHETSGNSDAHLEAFAIVY
jgi:hypothetical protein